MKPTPEQQRAIDAFLTGDNLTIEAGAGTGKTSTLRAISSATTKKGLYIAYNSAIAKESAQSFPKNVECRTAHSVAYRWTAAEWGSQLRARLNGPRQSVMDTAKIIGSRDPVRVNEGLVLAWTRVATIAMQTVKAWCYTADREITDRHVPIVPKVDTRSDRARLAAAVVPLARKAWEDLSNPYGRLRYQHDHYLKLWAMSNPTLDFDFVLVDEAQDSNGVVTGVVQNQTTQVAAVGDRMQAIYGWRGATDAMDAFNSKHHVFLTQSFRFGQEIADEANKWLSLLGAELRLTGNPDMDSTVDFIESPDAALCRTNAEAVSTVIGCHAAGTKVHFVGGGSEVTSFARAAQQLQDTGKTSHHELFPFTSWDEVQSYVEESHDGSDLKVMVNLVNSYGALGVIEAIEKCSSEGDADLVVSTAHKAKGREWDTVRIANDFPTPNEEGEISAGELMLAYVAVTRARQTLDQGGLSWVDEGGVPIGAGSI